METITPTLPQLLRDETASAPSIAGEPRLPHGDTQRIRAVLMLHGDAGALAGQASSSEQLDAAGIAVLTLDSFSGRGALATESSFGSMPFRIGGTTCVIDTDRALALLARHRRIDPTGIAVMGLSSDSTGLQQRKHVSRRPRHPGRAFRRLHRALSRPRRPADRRHASHRAIRPQAVAPG